MPEAGVIVIAPAGGRAPGSRVAVLVPMKAVTIIEIGVVCRNALRHGIVGERHRRRLQGLLALIVAERVGGLQPAVEIGGGLALREPRPSARARPRLAP